MPLGTALCQVVRVSALAPQADDAAVSFAIAAGPLPAFATASGMQLIYDAQASRHLRTVGVSGRFGRDEGLRRFLTGTGLVPHFAGPRTAALVRVVAEVALSGQEGATVLLDIVEVSGESAVGPVNGYVARRSATATKTGTPILEAPQAINVIGRKEIEDRQAQTLTQVLQYTPGVVGQYGNTDLRVEWLTVRGFVPGRYLDGLRLPFGARGYSQPRIEPYGLERVELLKGPSSGLYGQNSPGGLLNLVSKQPSAVPIRGVQLQTGSFGRAQGAFDLSGPVDLDGKILYRLTGLGRTTGTQVDFLEEDRLFIAPKRDGPPGCRHQPDDPVAIPEDRLARGRRPRRCRRSAPSTPTRADASRSASTRRTRSASAGSR